MIKPELLETENLRLVPYTLIEEDYVVKLHFNSSSFVFDDADFTDNPEVQKKKMRRYLDSDTLGWICWMKEPSIKVGVMYYSNIIPSIGALVHPILDREGYKFYISGLNGSYRKIRVMDEALKTSARYMMKKFNLLRLTGAFFEYNKPSIALCKRVGFKEEGLLRNGTRIKAEAVNIKLLGLLREEVL